MEDETPNARRNEKRNPKRNQETTILWLFSNFHDTQERHIRVYKTERDLPQEKCWVSIVTKRYSCTGDRKETHKKHKNLRIFFGDAKHVRLCDGVVCAGMQSEMNPD